MVPTEAVTSRTLALGGLVLVITALFSSGFHHWDEHFQIVEFAGWKLGITPEEALPWEFNAQLRPAIQPLIVVALYRCMALFGTPDPFLLGTLLRLFAASLSLLGAVMLVRAQLHSNALLTEARLQRWYLFLSFFLWFAVYNAVRFSSEGFGAGLFLIGYVLLVHGYPNGRSRPVLAGLLLGLAFVVRYQTGFFIAGLLAWALLIRRDHFGVLIKAGAGTLASVVLGILIDRWFYGQWTFTAWTYFQQNILEGKANAFGTEPWWDYFAEVFTRAVPPFSLLLLVPPVIALIYRRRDPLTWTVLPFLLVHMLIGHKEIRFLLPLACLLPLLIINGIGVMRERWWPDLLERRWLRPAARFFGYVHVVLLLVIMLKPADDQVALYRTIYRNFPEPITLVHDGEHPYHRVADIHFYRRPGLSIAPTDTLPPLNALYLYATLKRTVPDPSWGDTELAYTSFPDWVMQFNIGGWVDRTDRWSVYRITPIAQAHSSADFERSQ